jgi:MFS family permease
MLIVTATLLSGLGMGISMPAANNACIELMPHRVSTIIGVRGVFRQSGGAVSISIVTLLLHNTANMSRGFFIIFCGVALVYIVTIPLIFLMPRAPDASPPVR